jgi:hypothetical protein
MPNGQNRKGRSKRTGHFVQLHTWMMATEAWRSLSPSSRVVYIEIVARYDGRNNGWLALSARDAASLCRINKDTAGKAFRELIDRGFIECVTPGGFTRKVRHATEWRLTHHLCDATGKAGSKAYMKWRPKIQNTVPNQGIHGPKQGTGAGLVRGIVKASVLETGP